MLLCSRLVLNQRTSSGSELEVVDSSEGSVVANDSVLWSRRPWAAEAFWHHSSRWAPARAIEPIEWVLPSAHGAMGTLLTTTVSLPVVATGHEGTTGPT